MQIIRHVLLGEFTVDALEKTHSSVGGTVRARVHMVDGESVGFDGARERV